MQVHELAKELKVTSKDVLAKLKALKLKAKDKDQELSSAVITVLRSELKKDIQKGILSEKIEIEAPKSLIVPVQESRESDTEKKIKVTRKKEDNKKVTAEIKKEVKKKEVATKSEDEKEVTEKPSKKTAKVDKKKLSVVKDKGIEKEPIDLKDTSKTKEEKAKVIETPFVPLKPLSKKKKKPISKRMDGSGKPEQISDFQEFAIDGAHPLEHSEISEGGSKNDQERMLAASEGLSQEAKELKSLEIQVPISVKDFALSIQEKVGVVLKKLMEMRIFANINQTLDEDIVKQLAQGFGFNLVKLKTKEQQLIEGHRSADDDPSQLQPRAPVVTFMGHVDHGKTSLIDRIRKSKIVDSEHGGITQHIGAYSVKFPKGYITFLDTPGHEAFTAMRARGAHITDLVILVVAADEGIMPQTEEAIDHARAARVPIVVAMNKIDKMTADVDRVKKQLADRDLAPEDWGGKTVTVGVSAATGEGVDQLLEMILLEAEMLELKANPEKEASGIVVEAHMSGGKGAVASLIVQSGTLNLNDILIVGPFYGKVKAMFDCREKPISKAGPSVPVEILGLPGVPDAGEEFYVINDEKQAKEIAMRREQQLREQKQSASRKITLEDLYSQIKEGKIKELNVILKADVQGSLEALKDSLEKIPSDEVKVRFIHKGVGDVNASDVILASASNAVIIAFQVDVDPRAHQELEEKEIDVRKYRIIYDAVNDVRKALEGLLEPKIKRKFLSRIEVRQVFKLSKSGIVAGCYVLKGRVTRKAKAEVIRNGEIVYSGNISSLKRFKDDVREVAEGFECGLSFDGYDKLEPGDTIEAYELESIARTI